MYSLNIPYMAKKWQEIVVEWSFMRDIHIEAVFRYVFKIFYATPITYPGSNPNMYRLE